MTPSSSVTCRSSLLRRGERQPGVDRGRRAFSTAARIGEVLTEALLMIFTLVFFLYGGAQIWG